MQNTGLKNRFSEATRYQWQFWYSCNLCHRNRWDALHHIISPTVRYYRNGDFNRSVLNSCPIHNFKCHIGNDSHLHKEDVLRLLLKRTVLALEELGYRLNELDCSFAWVYQSLYKHDQEVLQSLKNMGFRRVTRNYTQKQNCMILDNQEGEENKEAGTETAGEEGAEKPEGGEAAEDGEKAE